MFEIQEKYIFNEIPKEVRWRAGSGIVRRAMSLLDSSGEQWWRWRLRLLMRLS